VDRFSAITIYQILHFNTLLNHISDCSLCWTL